MKNTKYFVNLMLAILILMGGLQFFGDVVPARAAVDSQKFREGFPEASPLIHSTVETILPDTMNYFKASNTAAFDYFGYAVALDGHTLAVTAGGEDSNATGVNWDETNDLAGESGAVYIFEYRGDEWIQTAYIKASNTAAGDYFGTAIALHGDTLVVGAPYEDSSATGVNGNQADNSKSNSGAVYVFTRNTAGIWTQQAYLKASNTDANDGFGTSVSVYGDTLAVGAPIEYSAAAGVNGNQSDNSLAESGAVYVFTRTGTTWSQQAYIKASNPGAGDTFGGALSLSADSLAVGSINEDSNSRGINGDQNNNLAEFSGAVYIFTKDGSTWSQQAYIKSSNSEMGDWFGGSVNLSGDTLLVGARGEDSNAHTVNGDQSNNDSLQSGAAYIFTRNAGIWQQTHYLKASNSAEFDDFGVSLSLDGNYLIISSLLEDSNATRLNGDQTNNLAFNSGAAYAFYYDGITWVQQAYIKASNTDPVDTFGTSVAVSNGLYVIGALGEDSHATGVNGDASDNSNLDAGAVYTVGVLPVFSDVEIVHWAFNAIETLYRAGITNGCSDNPLSYCPESTVTRAQMAVFIEKGMKGPNVIIPDSAPTFMDTASHWAEDWIEALKNDGITSGCGNGNYCPEQSITRAQMAVFLLKGVHGPAYVPPPAAGNKYSDVPADYWAAAWIERLASEGITSGCAAGLYCPESPVTRAQMAVFLVKAFNLP